MASGLLPKSPVSSSLCDEVPHIFIQKSHLEPREFLISSAKRLLQHNRPRAGSSVRQCKTRPRVGKRWRETLEFNSIQMTGVWSKIKTVGKTGVIPSRRGLAARRPLRFFGTINGALCGSADKWGETHGVGTYPGLHHRDGGPGAAAAERISGC